MGKLLTKNNKQQIRKDSEYGKNKDLFDFKIDK